MKPPKPPEESSPETLAWLSCAGVVYFVAVGDPFVAVKIGVAAQTGSQDLRSALRRRLDQIQSSNHEPIELIGIVYFEKSAYDYPMWHADALERELHNEFQHLARFERDTRGSEWFTCSEGLLSRIKQISAEPEALGLPRFFCKPILDRG